MVIEYLFTRNYFVSLINTLTIMDSPQKNSNRKKFLIWGAALLSSVTVLKYLPGFKKKTNDAGTDTVKMLTRDGKLVVVDKKLLASAGTKISNEELQKWIKKN